MLSNVGNHSLRVSRQEVLHLQPERLSVVTSTKGEASSPASRIEKSRKKGHAYKCDICTEPKECKNQVHSANQGILSPMAHSPIVNACWCAFLRESPKCNILDHLGRLECLHLPPKCLKDPQDSIKLEAPYDYDVSCGRVDRQTERQPAKQTDKKIQNIIHI